MAAPPDPLAATGDIAAALLAWLRWRTGLAALAYGAPPARVSGGFETDIFRLVLANAPPPLDRPLILRRLRPQQPPQQVHLEAAVQNALAGIGFPAPRAHLVEPQADVLGGPFLLMDEVAGQPLARGLDLAVTGAGLLRLLRLAAAMPGRIASIATTWGDMQARLHALPPEPLRQALAAAGLPADAATFAGRLAALDRAIAELRLDALRPVMAWLNANRPPETRIVICHGDFHPLNILADGPTVTGVIDWSNATLADPAFDIGSTEANLRSVPMGGPRPVRPLMRALIVHALTRYRAAYARHCAVDDRAIAYYTVSRCMAQLVGAARRRGGPAAGAHDSPAARRLLVDLISRRTGLALPA